MSTILLFYQKKEINFFLDNKYFKPIPSYEEYISKLKRKEILIPKYYRHSPKKSPEVSVVIPCFNCYKTIGKTLTNVINQYFYNIEIIVVDYSSTNESESIIREFMRYNKRIIYLHSICNPLKEALSIAKGGFIRWVRQGEITLSLFFFSILLTYSNNDDVILPVRGYDNVLYLNISNILIRKQSIIKAYYYLFFKNSIFPSLDEHLLFEEISSYIEDMNITEYIQIE